jgi:histidinol-phosphate/aromatic aminotransferase/cobyric acid decarboxylase-like protein
MRFPLADWIDEHADCRYDLARSGMRGVVRPPAPSRRELRDAREEDLRDRLAAQLDVHPSRVFLTHGATEGNAWVTWFVTRRPHVRSLRCRVEFPEYPPLYAVAQGTGFQVVPNCPGPVDLAVVSQPRNPVGDLWTRERMTRFAEDARATLVDETFREFTPAGSTLRWGLPSVWTTGTFTKAYGGDDIRVGYVVAPEREQEAFARFHGLVSDETPVYSVASALATLAARDRILRVVRSVVGRNRTLWARAAPRGPRIAGATVFDTEIPTDGDTFARRCLRSSVLVCSGSFFGDPSGVRLCLTRRTFPRDLGQYLAVRATAGGSRT